MATEMETVKAMKAKEEEVVVASEVAEVEAASNIEPKQLV